MWPFDDLVPWLRARIAEDRLRADLLAEDFTVTDTAEDVIDAVYEVAEQRAVLAMCDAYTAILDAVQRGLDGHPGECVNVVGDDPADWTPYDSCALHIGWAKTTLPPYAARLVSLAYQHCPGFREEWRNV